MARRLLADETQRYSWRPTALQDEALRRLYQAGAGPNARWDTARAFANRDHFFGACCIAMRHALADRRREAAAAKRPTTVPYEEGMHSPPEVLANSDASMQARLLEATDRMRAVAPDAAALLELRFVLGMSLPESAAALAIPERTARRRFAIAVSRLGRLLTYGD